MPDKAHQETDRLLAALERRIARVYKEARDDLNKSVKDYFKKFAKRDEEQRQRMEAGEITKTQYLAWRKTQIGRGERFEALREKMAERYTKAAEVAIAYVNNDMAKIYALNRAYEIDSVKQQAGDLLKGLDFTALNEQAVRRLLVEQPDIMPYYPEWKAIKRGIDLKYGKSQITKTVTSALLRGISTGRIASELQAKISTMSRVSAVRAARTAVTEAENAGRQDADAELVKKGVVLRKRWKCVHDGKTRPEHRRADGQEVDWDEPFIVGGEKLMFPGDKSRGASGWNLYQCRCVRERVVVGFKSTLTAEQKAKAKIRRVK